MRKKKPRTNPWTKICYFLAVFFGLLSCTCLVYPTISDAWNRYVSHLLISDYMSQEATKQDYSEELHAARKYNQELLAHSMNNINEYTRRILEFSKQKINEGKCYEDSEYETKLILPGNQMMGYLTIDRLDIALPIYHYSNEDILSKGIGHLYGSSLPVGGKGCHAVLTGHSGLMHARLFTDLEKMEVGDRFDVTVFNEQLTYEVDQICVVLPDEMEKLSIEEGEDYVTLMTCTPYGINTHRLLVRGKRLS